AEPLRRVAAPSPRARHRGPLPRALAAVGVLLLLAAVGAAAIVAPAASITITPTRVPIEPVTYTLEIPPDGVDQGEASATVTGEATGIFREPTAAIGAVVFSNWNTVDVEVRAGTRVAAGDVVFETVEGIIVPFGFFNPFVPGEASVEVVAVSPGPGGNVPADAIDTVLDNEIRGYLRGLPDNPNRLVRNPDPTAGGSDNEQPRVTRQDVNRAATAVRRELAAELDEGLNEQDGMLYAPVEAGEPQVDVPSGLVGQRGQETFTLSGTLAYRRAHVEAGAVEAAAAERLLADTTVVPAGRTIAQETVSVAIERVTSRGDRMVVRVRVTAEADPVLDAESIRSQVDGMTEAEAEAALSSLGAVDVVLWPGWVDRVPDIAWRVSVEVE
ncbi:MAG TPA: baseplate J/gp47 family protein, partial [Candidatus Limnocylindria bacterium]|nr:baseplate J/gp47 family protein [Candidatus Limnocylindria bacterium]